MPPIVPSADLGPAIVIDRIVHAERLTAGDKMIIVGSGFDAPGIQVLVNEQSAAAARLDARPSGEQSLTIDLTPEAVPGLTAGPLAVRVVRRPPLPGFGVAGSEQASSLTAMAALYPAFTAAPRTVTTDPDEGSSSSSVVVEVSPPVGAGQSVSLLLDRVGGSESLRVSVPSPGQPTAQFTVPVEATIAGPYLVRLSVEGFETALVSEGGRYAGPVVTLPTATR